MYTLMKTTHSGCGRPRNKPQDGGSGRISSGREALVGSAPWHVILRENKKVSKRFVKEVL